MSRILIVEDDSGIGSMLVQYLQGRGYECEWASDATAARQSLNASLPDVILLDWMLPGTSGYDFARSLRATARTKQVPILMLTARAEEADKIKALDAGADDYVTKPFSLAELAARINALLRRTAGDEEDKTVEIAGLVIDRETRRVTASDHSVALGPIEFELLYFFMTHTERVYSRAQLIQSVWNPRVFVEERTVDVHIRRLRKALHASGHDRLLQTVRGSGYRLSTRE